MMRNKIVSIVFCITFFATIAFSQNDPEIIFKQLKAAVQKANGPATAFPFNKWNDLIQSIDEIRQDTLSVKGFDYLNVLSQTGTGSSDNQVRQVSVELLCRCIGKNSVLTRSVISQLQKFKQTYYADAAKSYLKIALNASTNNTGAIAKLTAFACRNSCIQELQNALLNQVISRNDKKDIKLALLRAGQTSNEQHLLRSAKEQVLNDNFVYNLANDLTYTHNKVIFDYLLDLILNDSKSCSSANNDNPEPMICAYRLIEKVAPCINQFPAKLNAYNELDTKDYAALLKNVRTWIREHKADYTFNEVNY